MRVRRRQYNVIASDTKPSPTYNCCGLYLKAIKRQSNEVTLINCIPPDARTDWGFLQHHVTVIVWAETKGLICDTKNPTKIKKIKREKILWIVVHGKLIIFKIVRLDIANSPHWVNTSLQRKRSGKSAPMTRKPILDDLDYNSLNRVWVCLQNYIARAELCLSFRCPILRTNYIVYIKGTIGVMTWVACVLCPQYNPIYKPDSTSVYWLSVFW